MAVWALVLAVAALVSMGLGVLTTPIPLLGALFSFGAPALALAGVIVGGRALSQARQRDEPTSLANAGVITSAVAFVPALLTALTCGVCNALCSTGEIQTRRDFQFQVGPGGLLQHDAGAAQPPRPPLPPPPGQSDAGAPRGGPDAAPRPVTPGADDADDAPPPAFPPPPVPTR
jgi:hypothetical protein